uniref:Cyclin-dependent kinase G-2-like isoform X1 n=3 Tax=Hirondellea gigas TaxID=1518452 RepID=A0A6A7FY80_9CRUS
MRKRSRFDRDDHRDRDRDRGRRRTRDNRRDTPKDHSLKRHERRDPLPNRPTQQPTSSSRFANMGRPFEQAQRRPAAGPLSGGSVPSQWPHDKMESPVLNVSKSAPPQRSGSDWVKTELLRKAKEVRLKEARLKEDLEKKSQKERDDKVDFNSSTSSLEDIPKLPQALFGDLEDGEISDNAAASKKRKREPPDSLEYQGIVTEFSPSLSRSRSPLRRQIADEEKSDGNAKIQKTEQESPHSLEPPLLAHEASPPLETSDPTKHRDHHDGSSSPPSPFVQRQLSENENAKEEEYVPFDPSIMKCRDVSAEYERLNTIDEGMYGVVHRARSRKTGEIVALKKVKMERTQSGFPITAIREVTLLLALKHPNIVDVREVVVDKQLSGVYMVMEYMEHDLKALMTIKKRPFSTSEVKCLLLQLLRAVEYMHDNWVLHRDLKTSNLLLNDKGILKVCDLGMARRYGSPLRPYSHLVITLWYRSPELLLGAKTYSTAVDMWSVGCVFGEFLTNKPLIDGRREIEQLDKMFKLLGTPNEKIWPKMMELDHAQTFKFKTYVSSLRKRLPLASYTGGPNLSEKGMDLLLKMLCFDPEQRITATQALKHEWFQESPKPQTTSMMPTFPSLNKEKRRKAMLNLKRKQKIQQRTQRLGFVVH